MRRALLIIIIITVGGGGYFKTGSSNSNFASAINHLQNNNNISDLELSSSTQNHYPDSFPTPIPSKPTTHQHHHHKHRAKPPSPFTTRGLAIINRCTLAIQNKNRLKLPKWSDEYLIRPLTVPRLKPSILSNPHKIGGLYCRAGIWFEMLNDSPEPNEDESWLDSYQIRGTRNIQSRYALLEFYSIAVGLISIRGLETKNFLCMDRRGELYPAPIENYTTECVFKEEVLENYYNSYSSCAYGNSEKQWHLALRNSGIPRRGRHVPSYDSGAQFLVKELDKDFWVKPEIVETAPKQTNGFDDDGFNWLEKMTNSWQDLTKKKKDPQPSLIGIRNIDSELLEKFYDSISRRFTTRQSSNQKFNQQKNIIKKEEEKSQSLVITNNNNNPIDEEKPLIISNSEQQLRTQTAEELTNFMERKKRRMDREERRRRHRRKELEHLRKYPTAHKLRSVARYNNNHSEALNDRLRTISNDLSSSTSPSP